jgi:hypothetical protein
MNYKTIAGEYPSNYWIRQNRRRGDDTCRKVIWGRSKRPLIALATSRQYMETDGI